MYQQVELYTYCSMNNQYVKGGYKREIALLDERR